MKLEGLAGTFGKKIRKQKFIQYCEFFGYDEEEAKQDLRLRGYQVMEV